MSLIADPMTITFAIIAIALLVVIIFFMAYFNTILLIADFAYPNAMLKATDLPFLSRDRLRKLSESSREEFVESLRAAGYPISSGEHDPDRIESAIEKHSYELFEETASSMPHRAKPFFEAWMKRYDIEAIKHVIRAKRAGYRPDISRVPLYTLDRKTLSEMAEANDAESAILVLQGTEYELSPEERSGFMVEAALDRKFYAGLVDSTSTVDSDIARRVSEFVDMYADITNIRSALRARVMGIPAEVAMRAMVGPGSEVPAWKVKSMVEAADLERAVSEISSTSYAEALRGTSGITEIEAALDRELLRRSMELETNYSLDMGPALSFVVARDMETRNLKAINRASEMGLEWNDIEPMLVTEEAEA